MLHMMVFMGLWLAMGVQPSGEGWEGAGGGLCSAGGPRNLTLSGGANATQLLLYGCAEPATWDDAEGWCVERGGHLPSVRLASELAALGAITHFPVRRQISLASGLHSSQDASDIVLDRARLCRSSSRAL